MRPQDTGLLRSLIGLSEKEGDFSELLKYRQALAQADPSAANEIALANEYASQGKPEETWQIVQKNLGDVAKDPMAWKDVLSQISDPEYAGKIKGALESAILKDDSFDSEYALSQFQIQQGDLDGAQKTLWRLLARPLPAVPPMSATPVVPGAFSVRGVAVQGPYSQRVSQSYLMLSDAQQKLAAAQSRGQSQMQMRMRMAMYRGRFAQPGVTTTLDPAAMHDRALVFLTLMAVQKQQTADFLQELEMKIEVWHWPRAEKIVAYALIQAREPLMAALEEQAASSSADGDLDAFCYELCDDFLSQDPKTDDGFRKRAEAAQAKFEPRLAADPAFALQAAARRINRLMGDGTPAGQAKLQAAVDDYLKLVDPKDAEQLVGAIGICAQAVQVGNGALPGGWDRLKKLIDELAATDRAKWNPATVQQVTYLSGSLMPAPGTTGGPTSREIVSTAMQLFRLTYPAAPPAPALAASGGAMGFGGLSVSFGNMYNPGNRFPPPNRFLGPDRAGVLEQMFQQIKSRNLLAEFYTVLDEEEKSLTDWRQIYPQLLRIYFQWWDGKKDVATASMRKMLERDPSDENRQLLAAMLIEQQKFDDALPVLNAIGARYGPAYITTQIQILHTARQAKNQEAGKQAGERLLALHLPRQQVMPIMDDLRNAGLGDKVDELMKKQAATGPSGVINRNMQAANQTQQQLQRAINEGNDAVLAVTLARQNLSHDPLAASPFGNDSYLRNLSLSALKKFDQLDDYVADLEEQLKATPDSVRLNWLAGEACQSLEDHVEKSFSLAPGPQWLQLTRTGNKIEGFYSLNGTDWISAGTSTIDFPAKACIGFWIGTSTLSAGEKVSQVVLKGSLSAETPPSPMPTDSVSTNAATAVPPASTNAAPLGRPPASSPWQETDIESAARTSSPVTPGADGGFTLKNPTHGGTHYIYATLDGDGGITARFDSTDSAATFSGRGVGLMMREALDTGARAARIGFNPESGIDWSIRRKSNRIAGGVTLTYSHSSVSPFTDNPAESHGWTRRTSSEIATPLWFKLARKGNTFTGSASRDGKEWTQMFNREIAMGPDARVGVISATNGSASLPATWTEIKVTTANATPVDAAPSAPGSLPAPWEFIEIGQPTLHGSAQWKDSLALSPAGPISENDTRSSAFLFQSIHGDGEIVGRLQDVHDDTAERLDGLAFRSRLDSSAPEVEFFSGGNHHLGSYFSANSSERALKYFKRAAELDPHNQTILLNAAQQLQRSRRPAEASDLYAQILKTDFPSGMAAQAQNVLQVFQQAGRLPQLLGIIRDWTSPPLGPLGGGIGDMYYPLMQIAGLLRQSGQLAEAEQVYRKALSIETYQNKQEAASALIEVLLEQGNKDAAGVEIEKWIMDAGTPKNTPPPAVFAFNYRGQQSQNNWLQVMGSNQNGVVVAPVLRFLEQASDLGLGPKLRQELLARADKNGPPPNGQLDGDRVAAILLAIEAHDPAYRPMVEKIVKDTPLTSMALGNNLNAFLVLSQQLNKWPEERSMALRLVTAIMNAPGVNQNSYFKNIAACQVLRIARAMNDHKTAQAALRNIAENMRQQRAVNPNQVQVDQMVMVGRWMVEEGMLKEAGDLMADIKSSPQVAGNNYFQQKINRLQGQLTFAKGESEPVVLNYGLQTTPGKHGERTHLFWQANAGPTLSPGGKYGSSGPWYDMAASHLTKWRLELAGGPDEAHLKTIASWPNVASQGSETVELPAGTRMVQASLVHAKAAPPASDANAPIVGHLLFVGGANLIKNPDFTMAKDGGLMTIPGWRGLPSSSVGRQEGGPLPTGGFTSLEASNIGNGSEISSDRVAIQPGASYIFGAWVRSSLNLTARFLDANGKMIANTGLNLTNNNEDCWAWSASKFGSDGDLNIPNKAAFVEFVFRPNQDFGLAGISFQLWPDAAAAAPKPAPKSSGSNEKP